jgi:hypothetical protein
MTPDNDDDTTTPPSHPRNQVRVATVVQDGKITYAEDEEALRQYSAHRERSEEAARRRRRLWGEGGADSMARLCRGFPSLRRVDGADPWDATKILRFACSGHSHGEVLAAKFVLTVWNSTADWNEIAHQEGFLTGDEERLSRFDIFEAFGVWDFEHRAAALAWLNDPFWP